MVGRHCDDDTAVVVDTSTTAAVSFRAVQKLSSKFVESNRVESSRIESFLCTTRPVSSLSLTTAQRTSECGPFFV
jgi:hypothetical protein